MPKQPDLFARPPSLLETAPIPGETVGTPPPSVPPPPPYSPGQRYEHAKRERDAAYRALLAKPGSVAGLSKNAALLLVIIALEAKRAVSDRECSLRLSGMLGVDYPRSRVAARRAELVKFQGAELTRANGVPFASIGAVPLVSKRAGRVDEVSRVTVSTWGPTPSGLTVARYIDQAV